VDCPTEDILGAFVSGDLDPDLATEVECHLADCSRCSSTVAVAIPDPGTAPAGQAPIASEAALDRYHILGVAGKGAIGVVYAAYDPKLDRRVALKVLRRAGPELEERLLREARAMARVRSPHVVAVHDAGTADGQFFIAMEYVEGMTLHKWLDARKRSVDEVLRAFVQAGSGLAAAHAAGIVHRDFKPDNVLVRPGGQVAVTDFGLALAGVDAGAAGGEPGAADVHLTSTGMLVGTPAYMAPERLDGARADARSDLFSFCVALYAALYGHHPFPTGSMDELATAVRRGEVTAASDPAVPRRVREAILAGLRPRPEDRPASMEELLRSLERTPARRMWVAGIGLGAAILSAAAVAAIWRPAERSTRPCAGAERLLAGVWDEERRAEVRLAFVATGHLLAADTSRGVEHAIDRYATTWIAGRTEACEATRVRGEQSEAVLDERIACLDEARLRLAAMVRSFERVKGAQVANAAVAVYNLPAVDRCADPRALSEAVSLSSPAYGPLITLARATAAQARAQEKLGNYDAGLHALAPAIAVAEATLYRPLEAEVRLLEGELELVADPKAAEASFQSAAVAAQAGGRPDLAAKAWIHLTEQLIANSRDDEAKRVAAYAEATVEGSRDPLLRAPLLDVRASLTQDKSEALKLRSEALTIYEVQLGRDHLEVAEALRKLANALAVVGRLAEAAPLLIRALDITERAVGRDHPITVTTRADLGDLLSKLGRPEEALPVLSEALAAGQRVVGPDHPSVADTLTILAAVYFDLGRYREAAAATRRVLAIRERAFGADSPTLGAPLGTLSTILVLLDDPQGADAAAKRAIEIAEKHGVGLARALLRRGVVLQRSGHCKQAIPLIERAREMWESASDSQLYPVSFTLAPLAACASILGRHREAEALYLRALAMREKTLGPSHPNVNELLVGLARAYHRVGDDRRAAEVARRAMTSLVETRQSPNHIGEARFVLGMALWSSDRAAARDLTDRALADLASFPDDPVRREAERWRARHP
jgi:eukaryotic-like serine/threonine-protein kinase